MTLGNTAYGSVISIRYITSKYAWFVTTEVRLAAIARLLQRAFIVRLRAAPWRPSRALRAPPTDRPVGRVAAQLHVADVEPDAGEPVCEHGEHGHEQREHDDAVLRIVLQLLQQAREAQQARHLQ